MAHLSEILVSPVAQQQNSDVFGLSLSEQLSLNTSTSLVEGESSTPVQTTTIEVPVLEDAAPLSTHRVPIQPIAPLESEDEEIKNIDTRSYLRVITYSFF